MENRYRSSGKPSAFLSISGLLTLAFMAIFAASPASGQTFQGFEVDNSFWNTGTGTRIANRVASGTNGVTSKSGGWHGEAVQHSTPAFGSAFTNWGGYSSVFPAGGYTTQVFVYLDTDSGFANDTRFAFSSAINNSGGTHMRDFVFSCGFYDDGGPYGTGDRYVCTVSNNSPGWPRNPGADPFVVTTSSGWFGLRHRFYNSGGFVASDMSIVDAAGTTLKTWTIVTSDAIASAGGNRYGWFAHNEFPFLAIDDSQLSPVYRWVDTDGTAGPFDCSGSDAAHTTITAAVTAASAGEIVKVCPGNYPENVNVNKSLTIDGSGDGSNPLVDTIINPAGGNVVTASANDVTLKNFRTQLPGIGTGNGIEVGSVNNLSIDGVTATGGNVGIRTGTATVINGLTIANSHFDGNVQGMSFFQATSGTGNASSVSVTNTTFNNNTYKGIYSEKFQDAIFDGVTVDGSGTQATGHAGGIDINLKYRAYSNIQILNTTVTNSGTNDPNGGGIMIKARDDAPSYSTIPASLTGLVLRGLLVSGNGGGTYGSGIRIGESNNSLTGPNAGPSATISYSRIINNGVHAVRNATTAGTINAENNWWGCNYGPGATGAGCSGTTNGNFGTVDSDPWLTLTTSAAPSFVTVGGNATVTSPLTINSNNVDTSGGGNIPNGTPASFGATLGTVLPTSSTTTSGVASTVFTAGMTQGIGSASTTVDGQTTTVNIPIYNATCAQVSMPNLTTLTGVGITVPITTDLMTGRDAISADFTVTYNPAVLTYSGVTLGPVAGSAAYNVVHTPGTIVVSIYGAYEFTGSGVLANLNFSNVPGLPNDVSPMNFTSFMFNEGTPCDTNVNGSVTVIGGIITGNVTYGNALAPGPAPRYINNVTITGSGSMPVVSTTTDTNGDYSLSGFGPGMYTRTPSKTDVTSGSVTAFDASLISQHVVGLISLVGNQLTVADVSEAGGITSFDAALIARYTVSLAPFGVTGQWRFTPASNGPSPVYTNLTENYVGLLMGDVSGNWGQVTAYFTGLPAPGSRQDEARPAMVKAPVITANPDSVFEVPVTIRGAAGRGVVAYNFELSYDPNVVRPLENPVTVDDTVSGGLTVVSNAEGGVLRVAAFGVAPIDQDGVLIKVRFRAVGTPGSSTHLSWDNVFLNEDMNGATGVDGTIRIKSPHADEVETELSGRVMTATGERIAKAAVTITDLRGNSIVVYTDRSGVFTIPNVEYGQTYNVTVANTRYTFLPITISISDRAIGLDIVAEP